MKALLENKKLNNYRYLYTLKKYYLDALSFEEKKLAKRIKNLMEKYRIQVEE